MLVTMLRCKLHRATVTECDLHYQGSLKIDRRPHQGRRASCRTSTSRSTTSITASASPPTSSRARAGTGVIGLNGAAARKACVGDRIIICAYAAMDMEEAKTHKPRIVVLGASNKIDRITDKPTVE